MNSPPIKLLFIDDDPGLGRLVQKRLAPQSISVEHVISGADGLTRLATGGIDAVALDQNMPGADGLQTLARIRQMPDPPPVIFVTASEDSRIAVAALKAGAADYVTKDLQGEFIPLLKASIEHALDTARLHRAKEAAEAEVRAARDRFEALAAERAMLLQEVNHRVGNSLQLIASMLHMQGSADPSSDVKAALTQATHRVMAVAQVHRRLYTSEDVQTVAVDQYLESLVEDLQKSADSPQLVQITLSADPAETEPDRAVAVGIIVNELVTNALKYAYPSGQGPIRVGLKAKGADAVVSVEDDGVGYGDHVSSGLGQRIVKAMADKLGADVQRNSQNGTKIQITFALAAPKPAISA